MLKAMQIFVAPNKVGFSASYSKSGLAKKLNYFQGCPLHTVSLIHAPVALICSCGKPWPILN